MAAAAALLVGVALTFVGGFDYRCAATLRTAAGTSPAVRALQRKELLAHTWDCMASVSQAGATPGDWSVDSPGDRLLRVCLTTPDYRGGIELVRSIAEEYREKMREMAAAARETPTEAEDILSGRIADLQAGLNEAQTQVNAAITSLPETEPSEHREALLRRWQALQSDFDAARKQLSQTSSGLARQRSEPQPTYGLVSAEERRQALEADAALQQDLDELRVNLTELKLYLLEVHQRSRRPLGQLTLLTNELIETASGNDRGPTHDLSTVDTDESLVHAVREYRDVLTAFAREWNREFATAERLEIDPFSGKVLDVYQRVRRRLNDFLFDAGKRLATMRSRVQTVGADPRDTARHHVFQSNLTRSFQSVQAAHHRFEFAGGTIETPDNFRMDAALNSARGLRRRTQNRIRAIEERLETQARERTRKLRIRQLAKTEKHVEQVRTAVDRTIDELIALQRELNLNAEVSEAFFRAVLRAEIATSRLKIMQTDLTKTETQLLDLAARRAAADHKPEIELLSCGVIGGPVNLSERLWLGGIGAGLTLLAVLVGQWWTTRRA